MFNEICVWQLSEDTFDDFGFDEEWAEVLILFEFSIGMRTNECLRFIFIIFFNSLDPTV